MLKHAFNAPVSDTQAGNTPACNTIETQRLLNDFYLREVGAPESFAAVPTLSEYAAVQSLEAVWNAYEEGRLRADLEDLPQAPEAFRPWYIRLHRRHRQEVAGFFEHLSERASAEEVAFYVGLEEQVDGRFDDVIALAQIGMNGDMKLALAENYWDEMGLGKLEDMHTVMFERSTSYARAILARRGIDVARAIPPAALKNGNLLLMYALRRQYAPRLLGALTILEHTAPYRFARTVRALRRLGAPASAIAYHELHVTVDANHGKQLIERVLMPMVRRGPEVLREICIGCLIRYRVAVDYYRSIELATARLDLRHRPLIAA